MSKDKFFIAQIGRTVGLWGDLKLHLHTDFPEQFQIGNSYSSSVGNLTISDINLSRGIVKFIGYDGVDYAKKLTNVKIYSTQEETQNNCTLDDGQYFWFDIIGSEVFEGSELIGVIEDIQRMADTDYLVITTDSKLVNSGMTKSFLLPYIDRYVSDFNVELKKLTVKDAKDILEAS